MCVHFLVFERGKSLSLSLSGLYIVERRRRRRPNANDDDDAKNNDFECEITKSSGSTCGIGIKGLLEEYRAIGDARRAVRAMSLAARDEMGDASRHERRKDCGTSRPRRKR